MNICYCLDKNYLKYTIKSMKTFQKFNKDVKFYFFCNDDIPILRAFGKVIKYDKDLLKDFDSSLCGYKHVSTACFLRFLIPKYLGGLDRVLYVDGDTLCQKNINTLYNLDFEDKYYLAGCRGAVISDKQAKELNLPYYILSGMLLFNIKKMNEEDYFQQILDRWKECISLPKIFSGDETIINYVFHDRIKLVPEKFNYCYKRNYGDRAIPYKDVAILHIPGANKNAFWKF